MGNKLDGPISTHIYAPPPEGAEKHTEGLFRDATDGPRRPRAIPLRRVRGVPPADSVCRGAAGGPRRASLLTQQSREASPRQRLPDG